MSKFLGFLQLIAIPGYVVTGFDVHSAMAETDPLSVALVWMAVAITCGLLATFGWKWIGQ